MLIDIMKSAIRNFQALIVVWIIIVLINQIFIFGACFAPYCLVAAIPHTAIIALLMNHFVLVKGELPRENTHQSKTLEENIIDTQTNFGKTSQRRELLKSEPNQVESEQIRCPKCGAGMVRRTARHGAYEGRDFYGCENYPKCRGIVNIT